MGGVLWKIPPDVALKLLTLFNSPFGISSAVVRFLNSSKSEKTLKQRKAGTFYWNPSHPSSSKLPFLFLICSTTWCHKNYLERPQNEETINKKKLINKNGREIFVNKLYTINLYLLANGATIGEPPFQLKKYVGLQDIPPPLHFTHGIENTPGIFFWILTQFKFKCWLI